jgi:DNA-binding transcriptional ArsR family regulator
MDAFEALAAPARRRIIEMLSTGEHTVGELVSGSGVSFSAVSQHLRILSEGNIVESRRDGRKQIYRFKPESIDPVADWVSAHARQFWKKKLQNLGDVLGRMKHES